MGKEDANKPMSIVNDKMSDTPETDAAIVAAGGDWSYYLGKCSRKLERERDDLQKAVNGLCKHIGVSPANTTLLAVEVLKIQRERDEAITRRMETIMQCELYEQERDLARENCKSIVDKANELIARWDQPSWKDTAPTARYINALRIAVEAYERQKP